MVDGRSIWQSGDGVDLRRRPRLPSRPQADLSPAGIAVRGGSVEVSDLVLKRDIYYTQYPGRHDYGASRGTDDYPRTPVELFDFLADPVAVCRLAKVRSHEYELGQDRFMMMGDNSPRSKDSRGWDNRSDSAWDPTSNRRVAGRSPRAAHRQGVLRLLAARQAVRARHPPQPRLRGSRSGRISNG